MATSEMLERNRLTPEADEMPDDIRGRLFYLYKYTCPDCLAVSRSDDFHDDMKTASPIAIPSDSKDGKEFIKKWPVMEVPSLVYIYPDGTNYMSVMLHQTKDGRTVYARERCLAFLDEIRGASETFKDGMDPDGGIGPHANISKKY